MTRLALDLVSQCGHSRHDVSGPSFMGQALSRSKVRRVIRQSSWLLGVLGSVTVLTGGSLRAAVPGTATLSGTITASQSFQAAQVYIRNLDKGIVYMVYTHGGRFRAVALFPGNYEISASTKHLESGVQTFARHSGRPDCDGERGGWAARIRELRRDLPTGSWQGGRRAGVHGVPRRKLLPFASRYGAAVEVPYRPHGRQYARGAGPHKIRAGVTLIPGVDVPFWSTGPG